MKWGKSFWNTFHIAALGYPDIPTTYDKDVYLTFYKTFGKVLPCEKCKKHFAVNIDKLPVEHALGSKDELFAWTVNFHNIVNQSLGKEVWSVDRARIYFLSGEYASVDKQLDAETWVMLSVGFLVMIVIALFVWKYFHKKK